MNKQIEEMAKIIRDFAKELDGKCIYLLATCEDDKLKDSVHAEIAEALYNAGYKQPIKDDDVVLSKEKLEEIKRLEHELGRRKGTEDRESFYEKIAIPTERKETAREILQTIKSYDGWNELQRLRDDIAEKYGVEVE